jgi:dTDP-4-dehydrorhamnose 3,5-epimerase
VKIIDTKLAEVKILEPQLFEDDRGWFFEEFRDSRFADLGLPTLFRQENRSHSGANVLRGLHYQLRHPQGKLVTCTRGSILDVAVDIRRGSPTFGRWAGVELHADRPRMLWIPEGFAHGFCVIGDGADVAYKCTDVYVREDDRGILWNDPAIGIEWPMRAPLVSDRDRAFRTLRECEADLPEYRSRNA